MRKKVKGFTMIELIVVIAIIAVLAGVLVPNMITAIRKAKVDTANANAKAIFNASQTIAQQYEFQREDGLDGTINSQSLGYGSIGDDDSDLEDEFRERLERYFDEADRVAWRIYIEDYIVQKVISAERPTDIYVGEYPSPPKLDLVLDRNRAIGIYTNDEVKGLV